MYLQGAKMEGARYGGVTPRSFDGLASWHRATDQVELSLNNLIKNWLDISTNGRHLTAYNAQTLAAASSGGSLVNTVNGLAYRGTTNTTNVMACMVDPDYKKMLYDGRAVSITIVYRCNTFQATTGFAFYYAGLSSSAAGRFVIGAPTANQTIVTFNPGNTQIASNTITGAFSTVGGRVVSMFDIGYNSASSTLHRTSYLNNNVIVSSKFSAAPSTLTDTTPIILQGGAGVNDIYEIIIYDHTGKSQTQIDYERTTLYEQYILKRYPNLFL